MPRLDAKELAFGLFLIALALVAFAATRSLAVGSAADMGPGFVPRALAWIILGFGAAFLVTGLLKTPEPFPALAWRPLVMILASIALFAVLFSTLGLIAACVGTVVVAGAATTPVRWLQLVAFGVAIAAFSALLFVKGLGLPFKLW
ncbi:MAG TPA: tripartite tricarboxylate transporter TctB family protein [Xanthobacteraceae bacterium]|nr:tripartite tricarboxylate transporter TctB family protein [Xanthobacteraceae bacterium]